MTHPSTSRTSLTLVITGGIACGKSEVGRILDALGVKLLDTDALAHACLKPGHPGHAKVLEHFGADILDAAGRIDRSRLGAIVFSDVSKREILNAILHPMIGEAWRDWVDERQAASEHAAVMIPLYYEVGVDFPFDAVICVAASEDTMLKRLQDRGLSESEARARIAAQWPVEKKAAQADCVIHNNGSLEALAEKTKAVWQSLLDRTQTTECKTP